MPPSYLAEYRSGGAPAHQSDRARGECRECTVVPVCRAPCPSLPRACGKRPRNWRGSGIGDGLNCRAARRCRQGARGPPRCRRQSSRAGRRRIGCRGLLAQFAPWPLRTVYAVYLLILVVAAALTARTRETVESPTHSTRQLSCKPRIGVPPESRAAFIAPAVTAFATLAFIALAVGLRQARRSA